MLGDVTWHGLVVAVAPFRASAGMLEAMMETPEPAIGLPPV